MTPAPSSAPDPKDLERLVEFELKRLDDRGRAFGWTPWALLLALAAVLWQIGERSTSRTEWTTIAVLWAASILIWEFMDSVRQVLRSSGRSPAEVGRFYPLDWLLSGSREHIVAEAFIKYGACLIIGFWAPLWPFVCWLWIAPTFLAAVQAPYLLRLSYSNHALRSDLEESRLGRIGDLIRSISVLGCAVVCFFVLRSLFAAGVSKESCRIAALLVGATLILQWLTAHHLSTPIQGRLVAIRRAISLGEMGADDAKRAIDEALHGTNPLRMLGRHIVPFEDYRRALIAAQRTAAYLVQTAQWYLRVARVPEAEKILTQAQGQLSASKAALDRCDATLKDIGLRKMILVLQHPAARGELDAVFAKLSGFLGQSQQQQTALMQHEANAARSLALLKTPPIT